PATGDPGGPSASSSPFANGWPVKVGQVEQELLPVVGEGVTGSPVIGPVTCPSGPNAGQEEQAIGVIPDVGPGYIFNADGSSCYGKGPDGHDEALQTDFSASTSKYDTPAIPAVGHPAFGAIEPAGPPAFLAPAAG